MKKLFLAFIATLFPLFALAADVNAVLTVVKEGKPVYQVASSYFGMTEAEAAEMMKSGMKQLDFASKHQDKGGSYTIVWKWNNEPAIETTGMTFAAVNATLRMGVKWMDDQVAGAEKKEKQKKGRPWGN